MNINGTDLLNGMDPYNATSMMESGNMAAFAMKLRSMGVVAQKKVFMSGLIKSICGAATSFISQTKSFKEHYMKDSMAYPATSGW